MGVYRNGYVYANVLGGLTSPLTTTGNSGAIQIYETSEADNLSILLNVTAVSGTTPSMTVSVQWSNDGVTFADNDGTADTLAAITAAKATVKQFPVKGAFFRVVYTITGTTPSFTLTASARLQ